MSTAAGFREIEHTADWELEVWAPDTAGLIEQAALGMLALSGTRLQASPRENRRLVVEGGDPAALLINFLNELLFIGETENLGFDAFSVQVRPGSAEALTSGAPIAFQEKAIKAVTYHNLEIREKAQGLTVNVVFDV